MSESQIHVLSLNCWGLKYVAKHRTQRIRAIASELARLDHDIIGLQELWVFSDYELVRAQVSKRLPYSKFFYSGALGAGLALFSRFPIIGVTIHPYSLNGSPMDVIAGDWFVGKAASSVVVVHPVLGEVEVFNTHLFAKGGADGTAHRLINAWEFAKLARMSAEKGRYVIAIGDFNSVPTTLPMKVIRDYTSMVDAWAASHETVSPSSAQQATPSAAIVQFGVTADSPLNSYSAGKPLDAHARKHQGKRLDYIFYRQPSDFYHQQPKSMPFLVCKESKVIFTDKVPGSNVSFSDHFGLEATLDIRTSSNTQTTSNPDSEEPSASLHTIQPSTQLSDDSVATVLQDLVACYRISRSRSRLQLATFSGCIIILVGLVVSSAWLPRSWINPIYILFTVFISWLATTMLYIGFLYGNWERRALTNVIEELELLRNHRRHGRGTSGEST